ncbi:MAG: DUF2167 domain-containing protein [Hymenobacter sp.]
MMPTTSSTMSCWKTCRRGNRGGQRRPHCRRLRGCPPAGLGRVVALLRQAAAYALHWAKLIRFGNGLDQTLNYNVRILGRKGVLVFGVRGRRPASSTEIKASIPALLANVSFTKGEQYTDYNADLDEVAAYSIGGLVAGTGAG